MLDVFGFLRMLRGVGRLSAAAGLLLILSGTGPAAAFEFTGYEAADLDTLARRKPALGLGVDVAKARGVRLDVTLASPPAPCPTKVLRWAMGASGIAKDTVQDTPITHCIKVKSAKGRSYPMFIQDGLTDSLAKEVPQGAKLTLYGSLVYFAQRGPGIVINEFNAQPTSAPQPHSGVDLNAATQKE